MVVFKFIYTQRETINHHEIGQTFRNRSKAAKQKSGSILYHFVKKKIREHLATFIINERANNPNTK